MLALVKKPHIEISLQGDQIEELLSWIKEKYEVIVLADNSDEDSIPIEDTNFWKEMQSNRIGNLLTAARQKAGMTQKQVAEKVGIRQSMISDYERGRRRLTKKMGEKLSDALDINPDHLK